MYLMVMHTILLLIDFIFRTSIALTQKVTKGHLNFNKRNGCPLFMAHKSPLYTPLQRARQTRCGGA